MGALLVYVVKSAVCLALLFAGYRLWLRSETLHGMNRATLLGICVASFVLPALGGAWMRLVGLPSSGGIDVGSVLVATAEAVPAEVASGSPVSWQSAVVALYLAGLAIFFLRGAIGLFQLLRLLRSGRRTRLEDGVWLVVHRRNLAPFSWWNCVVISEEDLSVHGDYILTHEREHIVRRHTADLMLAGLCTALQWFNPSAWMLERELHDVHEFQADEGVLGKGLDARCYQLLLIEKAVGTKRYSLANSFNHSSLQKRITMMKKKKSGQWARVKYLCLLPLATVAVAAFARPEVSAPLEQLSSAKVTDLAAVVKAKQTEIPADSVKPTQHGEGVFDMVEQMPQFPGGTMEMMNFIGKNLKYPEEAVKQNLEERVIIQFIVGKDGTVSDAKVVRSAGPLLDNEGLRVINLMPRWVPGRQGGKPVAVRYTVPIVFRNDKKSAPSGENKQSGTDTGQKLDVNLTSGDNPMVICDGKEITPAMMHALDPNAIERVEVFKDEASKAKYGAAGRSGVILVTLKKK